MRGSRRARAAHRGVRRQRRRRRPGHRDTSLPLPRGGEAASSAAYHYADFPGKQKVFFLRDAAELQSTLAAVQASRYEGNSSSRR